MFVMPDLILDFLLSFVTISIVVVAGRFSLDLNPDARKD
jgi:hypothetical protein